MKLDVPFHVQGHNECGPIALKMILDFFGDVRDKEEIKEIVNSETSGTTWTLGLANAAGVLGYPTEFWSMTLDVNLDNFDLEFYKRETDGAESAEIKLKQLMSLCLKHGVKLTEKSVELDEILSKVNENSVPIILIDWNVIKGKEGYQGHFVPIVGYDGENVIIHQPGPADATAFQKIERSLFDKARKAKGTDEDIVFVSRKG